MLNCSSIIEELDRAILNTRWENNSSFDYRQYCYSFGVGQGSYIGSIQQFRFFTKSLPHFTSSKEAFFSKLRRLEPDNTFEIFEHNLWIELKINNFYPPTIKKLASTFGRNLNIRVFLKKNSETVDRVSEKYNGNAVNTWGYEFLRKRGIPKVFLSGPGLFDFSVQLFRTNIDERILTLLFIASERPEALLKTFGKDRIFPFIKQASISRRVFSKNAERLVIYAENQMLSIHNRVHKELISALCNLTKTEQEN